MIPYEIDPSLHPAPPAPPQIGDGFAPPGSQEHASVPRPGDAAAQASAASQDLAGIGLAGEQSAF